MLVAKQISPCFSFVLSTLQQHANGDKEAKMYLDLWIDAPKAAQANIVQNYCKEDFAMMCAKRQYILQLYAGGDLHQFFHLLTVAVHTDFFAQSQALQHKGGKGWRKKRDRAISLTDAFTGL